MANNKLGFGLMRLPLNSDNPKDIDIRQTEQMADLFLERGFTYFDTSYVYHEGSSENAIKKALVERHDRSSYTLATKFPAFLNITDGNKMDEIFNEQLSNCGVEYFDYYLLHNLNHILTGNVEKSGLFEHAKSWKEAGKIRHLGFSWHDDAENLDKVLKAHPEIEFVQIVINYYDWEEPVISSKKCYDVIRKNGRKVVIMEPVKGGMLANVPDTAKSLMNRAHPELSPSVWALRFAAGLDGVIAVLSGMSTLSQVDDDTAHMKDAAPLSTDDLELLKKVKAAFTDEWKIKCSDWAKLDSSAPGGIPVSHIIRLYNSCLLQPNPYFAAELNYYKLFLDSYSCADIAKRDFSSCSEALGSEQDAANAVKEAVDFLKEHSF